MGAEIIGVLALAVGAVWGCYIVAGFNRATSPQVLREMKIQSQLRRMERNEEARRRWEDRR